MNDTLTEAADYLLPPGHRKVRGDDHDVVGDDGEPVATLDFIRTA